MCALCVGGVSLRGATFCFGAVAERMTWCCWVRLCDGTALFSKAVSRLCVVELRDGNVMLSVVIQRRGIAKRRHLMLRQRIVVPRSVLEPCCTHSMAKAAFR